MRCHDRPDPDRRRTGSGTEAGSKKNPHPSLSALDAANRRAELLEKIDAAFAGGLRSNETMVAHAVLDMALKAAAEIAMDHKGSAERKRTERGLRLSKFSAYEQDEVVAEERGEDIASEMIAAAILALTSEGMKP